MKTYWVQNMVQPEIFQFVYFVDLVVFIFHPIRDIDISLAVMQELFPLDGVLTCKTMPGRKQNIATGKFQVQEISYLSDFLLKLKRNILCHYTKFIK